MNTLPDSMPDEHDLFPCLSNFYIIVIGIKNHIEGIMKKSLLILLALTGALFAQAQVKFQAFAPNFMKLGTYSKGYHSFELLLDGVTPWSFSAKGEMKALNNDPDLLLDGIDNDEVVIVIAYLHYPTQGADGQGYNVGMFDLRVFLSDEPLPVRNVTWKLLPPANDDWAQGSFDAAKVASEELGDVWGGKYSRDITVASADPLDREMWLASKKKPSKKRVAEPAPQPAPQAAPAPAASPKPKAKKRAVRQSPPPSAEDDSQLTEREKRRRAAQKKK